jgi:hypothetical protein
MPDSKVFNMETKVRMSDLLQLDVYGRACDVKMQKRLKFCRQIQEVNF